VEEAMALTKVDFAERVAEQLGYSKKEAINNVESVIALVKETLQSGENLKISGFGTFEVKQKRARRGRNPSTGEALVIEARRILSFKPSSLLKKAINT
jgi:integration host factor subunit alpha